ncbi:solute carrier family 41 member 1 [Lepeophtheirus salmonis]|uniref:solute carrier family 41 member 1 n=1 Tax=Lepeophtheirus salmonis TaxID=72036 RepID=UPI001AE1E5BE|nr:solute carrier family 41 member 1-like [Lepeophtheirus salmonis]XP_040577053.1 solute carrier family 41 member 1-like [Lepeophtheirus salmonis]
MIMDSIITNNSKLRQRSTKMGHTQSKEAKIEGFQLLRQEDEDDDEFITLDADESDENVLVLDPTTKPKEDNETALWITFQIFIPFILAGFGMVGAGLVLDSVQHWEVFVNVSEIFILVPALLGLKGNLEMTLASRLSTHAHLGHMDDKKNVWSLVIGNLALVQCQGIAVGFLASAFAIVMGLMRRTDNQVVDELYHGLLLCASSVLTASVASLVLGLVMIAVILISTRFKLNPDNIATPIAASLGDLTTLALLSWIAQLLYDDLDKDKWLAPVIITFYLAVIPIAAWIAYRNKYTSIVLTTGWTPVLMAMIISSIGGVILDFAVMRYQGIAVYQPVMNGVGGNLVAVQASRISTYLHTKTPGLGILPNKKDSNEPEKICLNPFSIFNESKSTHAVTAKILISIMVPGQLIFTYTISLLQAGHTSPTIMFLLAYLSASIIQIFILLHTAQWLINWMWKRKVDPDNSAIPYLTALGDLLGTGLLAISFEILYIFGDRDSDVGD